LGIFIEHFYSALAAFVDFEFLHIQGDFHIHYAKSILDAAANVPHNAMRS